MLSPSTNYLTNLLQQRKLQKIAFGIESAVALGKIEQFNNIYTSALAIIAFSRASFCKAMFLNGYLKIIAKSTQVIDVKYW